MNNVKRWKFGLSKCDSAGRRCGLTVEETQDNCGWVRYSDYADAVSKIKKLEREIEWLNLRDEQGYDKNRNMVEFMVNCVSSGNFKVYKDGSVEFGKVGKKSKK